MSDTLADDVAEPLLALAHKVEQAEGLDGLAGPVSDLADRATRPPAIKKLLSGTWLGHRLHPLLIALPIGAWSAAAVFDLVAGDERAEYAADQLIGFGIATAVPTAAAGLSDWVDTYGPEKRVGFIHATANTVALSCYGASFLARRAGRRGLGRLLALAGLTAVSAGGYLGGHLSYVQGVGVDRRAFHHLPGSWTPTVPEAELTDGSPVRVEAGGAPVMLLREGGRVHALLADCGHAGGPLDEGEISGGCVTCPWHGSRFRLDDGAVVRAPAAAPQPVLEVRVRDGVVEVKARG
jgi:nitrite reductase/ring-hydroxylating ferredoxin subunit/uncharacterized membrane protein